MIDFAVMQDIAQSLRDDPTFETMGAGALEIEARALLASQNVSGSAEEVRDVIEFAKLLEPTPPVSGERLRAHIPAQAALMQMERQAPAPVVEAPKPQVQAAAPTVAATVAPAMPLLYLFKLATNASEREIAEVIGCTRSAVSSYVSGRVPEDFSPAQKAKLREYLLRARAAHEAVLSSL